MEDLADPRWEGTLAIEAADVDWYRQLWTYWVEEEGLARPRPTGRFEAIASNAIVVKGHSALTELLAGGEFSLCVNYLHVTDNRSRTTVHRSPGSPRSSLSFPYRTASLWSHGAAPSRRRAPLHDWLLGPGQEVLAERNVDPVRKGSRPRRGHARARARRRQGARGGAGGVDRSLRRAPHRGRGRLGTRQGDHGAELPRGVTLDVDANDFERGAAEEPIEVGRKAFAGTREAVASAVTSRSSNAAAACWTSW